MPEPTFEAREDRFTVTFLQNPYTEEWLREMGLSDRQLLIMHQLKEEGSISNAEVRALTEVSNRTALRDLSALEEEGLVRRVQQTGRGARYEIIENPPNPP